MLPALFVSRGLPTLPFTDSPAKRFLSGLSGILPRRPRAILAISTPWEDDVAPPPDGFAYSAPGAPGLTARALALLDSAGLSRHVVEAKQGACGPLSVIYPNADIPVARLSLTSRQGPLHHLAMGRALASLGRDDDVLILGSGSFSRGRPLSRPNGPEPAWVAEFARWMHAALHRGSIDDLLAYRTKAPFADRNHPTDEHLLPLFVALGAGGAQAEAKRLHASVMHGVLRMDVYAFRSPCPLPKPMPRATPEHSR